MIKLKDCHLLITRPVTQGRVWAEQLQAMGAQTTEVPMLVIEPITALGDSPEAQVLIEATKKQILQLDEFQKIIFVSQNAVEHFIPWLDQYWPQLPVGLRFFAVGTSTAKQLQTQLQQIDSVAVCQTDSAMNSEALLDLAPLQSVKGEKIAIVRGVGGRTLLGDTLTKRGASVESIAVYQRIAPKIDDWQSIQAFIDNDLRYEQKIVAAHSAETIANLCKVTPDDLLTSLKDMPLLVPGKRVCDYGHSAGFNTIITAQNATHSSMTEALYDWQQRQS